MRITNEIDRGPLYFGALIFTAYLWPLHSLPFSSFYNEIFAVLGILVLLIFSVIHRNSKVHMPWLITVLLAIVSVIVLQVLFSVVSRIEDAVLPITCLLLAALAVTLGASRAAKPSGAYDLCRAIAISHVCAGMFSAVIATFQFADAETPFRPFMMLMDHKADAVIRPFANIAQPNQLALLFCMAIASLWWLYQAGYLRKWVAASMIFAMLFGLALTQSRIGWIIVPAFALAIWHWNSRQTFRPLSNISLCVFVLSYILFLLLLPSLASLVGGTVYSPIERIGGSGSARLILYAQALQMSLAHPLAGVGWGQFKLEQVTIAAGFAPSVYSGHAHNIVLNLAAEIGWVCTFCIVGALAYWTYKVFWKIKISNEVAYSALFLLAVLVHSMVEYPLWYAYVLLPVGLLMGLVHQEQIGASVRHWNAWFVSALTAICCVGLVAISIDYQRLVSAYFWMDIKNIPMQLGVSQAPRPSFTLFSDHYDYFDFVQTAVSDNMSDEDILKLERQARHFSFGPALLRMSLAYGLNGKDEDAIKAMLTIKSLHPDFYNQAYNAWKKTAKDYPQMYKAMVDKMPEPDISEEKLPNA